MWEVCVESHVSLLRQGGVGSPEVRGQASVGPLGRGGGLQGHVM